MALAFVRTTIRDVERFLDEKATRAGKASIRALNHALQGMRTTARRSVQADLNLKARDINAALSVRRARSSSPNVVLTVTGRATPLERYGARARAKGVSVKVKRRGSRKLIRGAFITTLRSGHRGVYVRERGGNEGRVPRLPIEELLSTSVEQFVNTRENIDRIHAVGEELYRKELVRQLAL